jgi:beta-lactam-binding protein with PASTA domain
VTNNRCTDSEIVPAAQKGREMSTQPPADDAWPTPDAPTVLATRETRVAPPPPPPQEPPPSRRIGEGMLLAIVVIVLVVAGLLIAWFLTHRHHDRNANGTTTVVVTTQGQGAGGGAAKIAVPRVVGLTKEQAVGRLAQVGLSPKLVTRPAKSGKAGTVTAQQPTEATTLRRGSTVTLFVAKAVPTTVPNVVGQQQSDATSALQDAGLTPRVVQVPSARPKGQVTAQHPTAGAKPAKGSTVRINVSSGGKPAATTSPATTAHATSTAAATTTASPAPAQPATASVPDVTHSELQAAVQQLDAAGFLSSVAYVPGDDPLGTIEAQSPDGGATAKTGSHVTVNASSGPGQKEQETVPDARGQKLHQAVATMQGANLRLIFVKVPVSDRAQVGTIVDESPAAGDQAPKNAQVLVYLGVLKR